MKFACPYCRKESDYMDMQLSEDLRAIIAMSESFGRHRALAWAYAELFGVTPLHAKAKKLRVILMAVKKVFDASGFTFQKRLYRISPEGIAEALNAVVVRNFASGLDSHNYLKKVMINIAEREDKDAGRTAEKDLRKRETAAMSGRREEATIQTYSSYPVPEEQVEAPAPRMKTMPRTSPLTDAELEANRQRLKNMLKQIG